MNRFSTGFINVMLILKCNNIFFLNTKYLLALSNALCTNLNNEQLYLY